MSDQSLISDYIDGVKSSGLTNGTLQKKSDNPLLKEYLTETLGDEIAPNLYSCKFTGRFCFKTLQPDENGFICAHKINSIRRVNKFLEAANENMQNGHYLVTAVETKDERKERLLKKYPKPISYPYYTLDFVLKRVFPKLKPTRSIYFSITGGKNRVISLTEALGRLVSCGFEIVGYKKIGGLTYIISRKVRKPYYDMQPTYGAIIRLKRVGYEGKVFDVFKVRTMYPYSEYLQDYVYQLNNLGEGGKFQDDFRTTSYGNFFRRFWIDELPMIYNWLRRDMKLVGVRPLSEHYYYLYPKDIQEMRTQTKPGLIPPYYADLPKGLDEILESEKKYLEAYQKNPIKTDIRYLFKALKNIIVLGARSR